jgi:hypothetical protein
MLQLSHFWELDGPLTGQETSYILWSIRIITISTRACHTIQSWLNPENAYSETNAVSFLLRKEHPGRDGWTLVRASQTITRKCRLWNSVCKTTKGHCQEHTQSKVFTDIYFCSTCIIFSDQTSHWWLSDFIYFAGTVPCSPYSKRPLQVYLFHESQHNVHSQRCC